MVVVGVGSVMLLLVIGIWVVGVFLMEKALDVVPQSFKVKTIVRFSPADEEQILIRLIGSVSAFINNA